ncbi:hypothetical protein PAPYR_10307 [Paratrimastix pyriformis]|uniref:Uncharacterized protein n=1 Tax=Paratrimastix pyriformis TaxID=342808 RepID=A0ABQ8UAE8_9EUKA|nr:hypothetical protein PAPYR_10307 [Paratrimastix pyriformis]
MQPGPLPAVQRLAPANPAGARRLLHHGWMLVCFSAFVRVVISRHATPHCMTLVWRPLHALFEPAPVLLMLPAWPQRVSLRLRALPFAVAPPSAPLVPVRSNQPPTRSATPSNPFLPCSLGLFLPCSASHRPTRLVRGACVNSLFTQHPINIMLPIPIPQAELAPKAAPVESGRPVQVLSGLEDASIFQWRTRIESLLIHLIGRTQALQDQLTRIERRFGMCSSSFLEAAEQCEANRPTADFHPAPLTVLCAGPEVHTRQPQEGRKSPANNHSGELSRGSGMM